MDSLTIAYKQKYNNWTHLHFYLLSDTLWLVTHYGTSGMPVLRSLLVFGVNFYPFLYQVLRSVTNLNRITCINSLRNFEWLSFNAHISIVCSKSIFHPLLLKAELTIYTVQPVSQSYCLHGTRQMYHGICHSHLGPPVQKQIDSLEKVQRQAALFIAKDYRMRTPGCVFQMLESHNLQQRRKVLRLSLFYKISEGVVPAIPPNTFLTKVRNKRKIKAKPLQDFVGKNIVKKHQQCNSKCYQVPPANKENYRNSFL